MQQGKHAVYASGAGFAAFIRGGGNVPLHRAVSSALQEVYEQFSALTIFDIGVGAGLALLPALTPNIRHLDLIEPSAALLAQVCAALDERGMSHRASAMTLQEFVLQPAGPWDVVQGTFSLQSIAPAERPALFQWIRERGQRLLIAEFDVPLFEQQHAPDHVQYVVEHYGQGLAEYNGDRDLVAQEFLIPMLFGYFDQTAAQLRAAGFEHVERQLLYPYWWAPAYLLDAC